MRNSRGRALDFHGEALKKSIGSKEWLGSWFKTQNSGEQSAFLVPFSFSCAKAGIFLQTNFYSLNGSFYFILQPHIKSTKSCKYSKHPCFQKLLLQLCFPSVILETEDIYSWILPIPKLQEMNASLEKNIYRYLFCSLNSSFQAKSIHGEWQQTKIMWMWLEEIWLKFGFSSPISAGILHQKTWKPMELQTKVII